MTETKNMFKGYQEQKITGRLVIINQYIDLYKKQKVKFKNITELANRLASEITKEEGKACSQTTLLRNEKYKSIMEDFFYSQSGTKRPKEVNSLLAELTQSNIERENMRLKQYIANLEQQISAQSVMPEKEVSQYLTNDENETAKWKNAFMNLVQHFDGLVAFDNNGNLIDLSKKFNNIIIKLTTK